MKKLTQHKILIFWWLLVLVSTNSFSQHVFPVKRAQVAESVSINEILDAVQDSLGYIWLATDEGLYRFDGYNFEYFGSDRNDTSKLQHHYINKLLIDKNQNLWIGTFYGLHKYIPRNNSFQHIAPKPEVKNALHGKFINDLLEDGNGQIWIATYRGLTSFKPEEKTFQTFDNSNSGLPTRDITALQRMNNGSLLIGTKDYGVWMLEKGVFIPFEEKHSVGCLIWDIYLDGKGNLWIATETKGVLKISSNGQAITYLKGSNVKNIERLPNGDLILGNHIWQIKGQKLEEIELTWNNHKLLAGWLKSVYSKNGLTWVFSQNNVFLFDEHQAFQAFPEELFMSNKSNLHTVTSVSIENNKMVYKLLEKGVYEVNLKTGETNKIYQTNYIWEYRNEILKIGSTCFYIDQKGFWESEGQKSKLLLSGEYRFYFMDLEGVINLIPMTDKFAQITKYNPETMEVKTELVKSGGKEILPVLGIIGCKMTRDSTWWLFSVEGETSNPGLFRKRKGEQQFEYFSVQTENSTNVFFNDICLAPNGTMFLATENGMSIIDNNSNEIVPYHLNWKKPLGIKAITSDGKSKIWFSTIEGLYSLNVYSGKLKHYGKSDGISDVSFYLRSAFEDENGVLYFGNNKGITFFNPDSVSSDVQSFPPVIASMVAKGNQENVQYFPEWDNHFLELESGVENLTFHFILPGAGPLTSDYLKYKLEGIDTGWVQANFEEIALYNHLPRGEKLRFRVQQISHENKVIGESELTVFIKKDYSYLIFALIAVLLILLLVFVLYYRRYLLTKRTNSKQEFKTKLNEDEFLQQLNKLIDKNLNNSDFGSAKIETELGLSRSKLFRMLKEKAGMSVTAYVRDYRLMKAHELIQTRKYTISEIIHEVGFNSRSYFYRCFKEKYGENPTELK